MSDSSIKSEYDKLKKNRKHITFKNISFSEYKNNYIHKPNNNNKSLKLAIIIPFREPLQHAFSLYNQHKKFISLQKKDDFIRKYMFWIGHSEFGMDYELIFKDNIIHEDSNE